MLDSQSIKSLGLREHQRQGPQPSCSSACERGGPHTDDQAHPVDHGGHNRRGDDEVD